MISFFKLLAYWLTGDPFFLAIELKITLLIMQIIFYYIYQFIRYINTILFDSNIKETPGLILNSNFYSEIIENSEPFLKEIDNPESDSFFDKYDFSNIYYLYFDYIDFYFWILLPIILYFFLIYFLHGMFGLYSAYVDYFQKNPNHVDSMRGFLPALFIFYFLIFIIFSIFFFSISLYLIYILWFVFI